VDGSDGMANPDDAAAPLAIPRPRWLACLAWLRGYSGSAARGDLLAGLTLAAYLVPAGIGDASLANLPPEAGLYACLFSGLVFWIFCSSRRTAITVTSAISLLMGTSLGAIAGGDPGRFVALAAGTAVLVGIIGLGAWAVGAGSIVRFISETVLSGFKAGTALYLASSQLPKLLGIPAGHGGFWQRTGSLLRNLGDINPASAAVGGAALAVLIAGKVFLKNKPVAIVVVIGGVVAGSMLDLGAHGVKLLGEIPRGLPPVGLPAIVWDDLNELLPLALACFLLGAVETAAIGRMFAAKHGERFDANQELLGVAAANLGAGLGGGFPVSGGMSQSLVNESAGARTPLSGLVGASVVLLVVLFFTGLLRTLPQPVLAAIVLMAVAGLIQPSVFKRLWRTDRGELLIATAALVGVLSSGLLRGVMIGVVLSLVMLLRAASRPNVAFLGRIPGTRRYSDMGRHADNERVPGVVIFRPEGSIVYFNTEHVVDTVMEAVRAASPPPRLVLCDLSAAPRVDLAGAEALKHLAEHLKRRGVGLRLVDARSSVRDRLRAEGLEESVGPVDRFTSVEDAVEAFLAGGPGAGAPAAWGVGR
jgi:SulP family sulfate permease